MQPNLSARLAFSLVFLCAAFTGFSQNAFYDAKKIVRWSKMNNASVVKTRQADTIKALIAYYTSYYPEGSRQKDFTSRQKSEAENLISQQNLYRIDTADLLADLEKVEKRDTANIRDPADKTAGREILRAYRNYKQVLGEQEQFSSMAGDTALELRNLEKSETIKAILTQFKVDTLPLISASNIGEDSFNLLVDTIRTRLQETIDLSRNTVFARAKSLKIESFRELFRQSFIKALNENPDLIPAVGESSRISTNVFTGHPGEEIKITIEQSNQSNTSAPNLVDLNFPSQSDLIDAIAIYLAKRTKQEAVLFFLERLEKTIARDDLAQDLFPETWKVMQEMDYNLTPRFGAKWQNAISADYIRLPVNIRESPFIQGRLTGKDSVGFSYFADALTFAELVGKKFNFLDIVRTLYYDPAKLKGEWTKLGIKALHIINTELRDSSRLRYNWIHPQEWLSMSVDELTCFYELVRLRYRLNKIPLLENTLAKVDTAREEYDKVKSVFGELLTMLRQFNDVQQKSANKEIDGSIVASDGFWDAQRNLVDFLVDNAALLGIDASSKKALTYCKSGFFIYDYLSNKNYAGAATEALSVISALTAKKYKDIIQLSRLDKEELTTQNSQLLPHVEALNRRFRELFVLVQLQNDLRAALPKNQQEWELMLAAYPISDSLTLARLQAPSVFVLKDTVESLYAHYMEVIKADYTRLKQLLDPLLPSAGRFLFKNASKIEKADLLNAGLLLQRHNNEFHRWLTEIATLFTEISAARKSNELAMVIESYALPPGSYRIKRNSTFSIDLNAFTGVYGGLEWIEGTGKKGFVYGVTAPVGFAFSWGFPSGKSVSSATDKNNYVNRKGKLRRRSGSSLTVDLTVIDVGAAFSFRLTNSSEGLPSKVKWDQVISPALNVRLGLKNSPFVIGAGLQRTPKLRSFKEATDTSAKTPELSAAFRLHLTAAFDLPLINIHRSR